MWQRFTERARRVVFFAQEEAARLGENYVGTEHVLLGLVRENDSVAARILERLGVPLGRIRSDIERQVTRGHGNLGQDMQLTPRAKRVIDLAYEEARQLNNNYIGTEHLLLGLIREGDGLAAHVLVKLGADLERTRREVYSMQEGEGLPSEAGPAGTSGDPYLSDEALRVLETARDEVARHSDRAVGTEHLLLALLGDDGGVVSRVLQELSIAPDELRRRAEQQMGRAQAIPGQPLPLRWHTTRILDRTYEEARQFRHDTIGAQHLLLALLAEGDCLAAHLLEKAGAGVTASRLRAQFRALRPQSDEPRAEEFLRRAQEEAGRADQLVVTPEHLLIGMLRDEEGPAAHLLRPAGVAVEQLAADLGPPSTSGPAEPSQEGAPSAAPPLTPRAEHVVDRAREEAKRLRSASIGREHLLLGLARDGDSLASQTLQASGITYDRLVSAVEALRPPGPGGGRPETRRGRPLQPGPAGAPPAPPGDDPFRRFNQRSRQAVTFAREEMQRRGESAISTPLLLLGLLRDVDSDAAHILERRGLSAEQIRAEIEVEQALEPEKSRREVARSHVPGGLFTLNARRVIDLAFEETRLLNHSYIGTEHLLLGLIREGDGLASHVLTKVGADVETVRREVIAMQQTAPAPTLDPEGPIAPEPFDQPAPPTVRPSSIVSRKRLTQAIAAVRAAREPRLTDLVSIQDLTPGQARSILSLARTLKETGASDPLAHREILAGKVLAMIFEKPSLRTRVTFETGMFQLGGHAISLQPAEIQLGQRETVADAARNLERWVHGIMARTFRHEHVVELAQNAQVPVINGLTDREHPCQALADFLTIQEKKGRTEGLKLAFIGDGNNVAHSLLLLGAKLGTHVTVAGPEGYAPDEEILRQAREAAAATGAQIQVTHDPLEAVRDADVVYTDVWASMGQEAEAKERRTRFAAYQVNTELVRQARWDAIVMHDLPAHRGEEIMDEVMDGPQSVVFDQAENRLHAQKALLAVLLG